MLARGARRVLVEQPTYDRPLLILERLGAEIVPVPLDEDGLELDALERALDDGEPPAFLYTIPTFQNPSGLSLSVERRRRLVELAAERELLVLEDDPYGLVRFEGEPPPSLFSLDESGWVGYSSSFSKTIAPGLRVGYYVLPEGLESALEAAATSTYITPVLLAQATVHEFLRRGNFEPNLERVSGLLRARRDAMLSALDEHFPGDASWSRPEGGYFLWLELPERGARRRAPGRGRGRGRRLRQGRRLRRRGEHGAARLQLRLAGRDPRGDRAPGRPLAGRPRGLAPRLGRQPGGLGGRRLERVQRPRHEPGLRRRRQRAAVREAEGGAGGLGREGAEARAPEVAIAAG